MTVGRSVLTIPTDLATEMDWVAPLVIGDERIGYEDTYAVPSRI